MFYRVHKVKISLNKLFPNKEILLREEVKKKVLSTGKDKVHVKGTTRLNLPSREVVLYPDQWLIQCAMSMKYFILQWLFKFEEKYQMKDDICDTSLTQAFLLTINRYVFRVCFHKPLELFHLACKVLVIIRIKISVTELRNSYI